MHARDTGVIRVDTRCQPLVTALLLRDANHLSVNGPLIPGPLDLPGIGPVDTGTAASVISTREWAKWWNDLVSSISAGDLTSAYTGASPALIRLIDQFGELDSAVGRAWEVERVDAAAAFARLAQVCAEMATSWHLRSSTTVCVLPVVDAQPLSAPGVMLVPLRLLRSASLGQVQDLMSRHLASE